MTTRAMLLSGVWRHCCSSLTRSCMYVCNTERNSLETLWQELFLNVYNRNSFSDFTQNERGKLESYGKAGQSKAGRGEWSEYGKEHHVCMCLM